MNNKIRTICKNLEKKKNIRILFAVENGSRAWRMNSKDSDYDVRFVFVRPLREYIQINKPKEVINLAFDKEGNQRPVEGSFIDMSGFDIFKYVKLLASSNPTMIEWLISDIVYYGKQNKVFRNFAMNNFKEISLYHHYKSMCRKNYEKYIQSGKHVSHKKYLYAYRGLVNAKWAVHKKSIPPLNFIDALKEMQGIVPEVILVKLKRIIDLKSRGKEKDLIQNIVEMDDYIENFLNDDSEAPRERARVSLKELDDELRKIVIDQS